MQVVVDSILTNYVIAGNGPSVLLLHGWGDSHKSYNRLASSLAKSRRVVALDLPGFGATDSPKSDWGLDDYADFVAKFVKKIDVQNLDTVIGHSNGGAIAIRAIASGKLRPSKLVLIGSSGIRNEYKGRNQVLRIIAKMAKLPILLLPKNIQTKIKKKAYKTIGSDLFVAEHLQETFKKVITDDVRSDAKNIKAKTLLIYGSKDTATPVEFGKMFNQAIRKSRLEVIDGAGHYVHIDEPHRVQRLIEEFMV